METTIAAISTAMSASGIGIIRISGENAMDVISRIYRSKGGKKKIKEVPTHTIYDYGHIESLFLVCYNHLDKSGFEGVFICVIFAKQSKNH